MADHTNQHLWPATGAQYQISRGDARVTVAELAGSLRSFRRGGVELTETYPDDSVPPAGAGILLAPWPNRVADGQWTFEGRQQQLDITEVDRNNAIHGLLRNAGYQLVEHARSKVVLAATIFPQHGYPFHAEHQATYELDGDQALTVTQQLVNRSGVDIPFAVGAHPYLRIGDIPSEELTLTINAGTRLATNDRLIPTGTEPVAGSFDLREGRKVADLDLDTCFTDLAFDDGRCSHTLSADDGRTVTLWMDEEFAYTQVFVTDQFPGRAKAVAMEPMTAPADAFNSGDGLRWLEPGGMFRAAWGISADLG
ncbi:aldose 1-epimerase family protein [Arthrobacter castelli]|uniref:aldose 1-epimerase family protein n=1 Tax=Arthrobacter castelli TaxID=271431 RepID=UPI000405C669|nr:aldose 1-epimerase family protein [Arthrobacter castelli]